MSKKWHFILFITIGSVLLFLVLLYLSLDRQKVPVHVKAKLNSLKMIVGQPFQQNISSSVLLKNLNIVKIEMSNFDKISLKGMLYNQETNNSIYDQKIENITFQAGNEYSTILLSGKMKISEFSADEGTEISISPKLHLKSIGSSIIRITLGDTIEILWEECILSGETEFSDGDSFFTPHLPLLEVGNTNGINQFFVTTKAEEVVMLEKEIPIQHLDFMKKSFDTSSPILTTSILEAEIIFPTFRGEGIYKFPEGSYLKIGSFENFILKNTIINQNDNTLSTIVYGYTDDVQAAYGLGEFTQLLPPSLIILWRNITLVVIFIIMVWFIKTTTNIYNQWREWGSKE